MAQRVLGESNLLTFRMTLLYAATLCNDTSATLDDLREAVTTLEDKMRIARRVLGGAHPITVHMEASLQRARDWERAREAPSPRGA